MDQDLCHHESCDLTKEQFDSRRSVHSPPPGGHEKGHMQKPLPPPSPPMQRPRHPQRIPLGPTTTGPVLVPVAPFEFVVWKVVSTVVTAVMDSRPV